MLHLVDVVLGAVVLIGVLYLAYQVWRQSFGGFYTRVGKGINPARAGAIYNRLSQGERDAIEDTKTFLEVEAWLKENKKQ
jgi:hypothetical protein